MRSAFLWHSWLGVFRGWIDPSLNCTKNITERMIFVTLLRRVGWLSSHTKLSSCFGSSFIHSSINTRGVLTVCQVSFWSLGRRHRTSHSEEVTSELRSKCFEGARHAKIRVHDVPGRGNSKQRLLGRERAVFLFVCLPVF